MAFDLSVRIKNKYEFNKIDLDFIGDDLSVVLENDYFCLYLNDTKLIELDDSASVNFDKEKILKNAKYIFTNLSHNFSRNNEYIDFEFEVNVLEQNQIKIESVKKRLRFYDNVNYKTIGIYLLKIDNVNYIGQSSHIYKRLDNHLTTLNDGKHTNDVLQEAWDEGFENITLIVLEKLDKPLTPILQQEWLAEKEIHYIEKFSQENLANKTKGELIVTSQSYAEYIQRNSAIEKKIKDKRKEKKIEYQKLMDENHEIYKRNKKIVDSIELQIKALKDKKSFFKSFISYFGVINQDERDLLELKAKQIQPSMSQNEIFELNYKMSQLRKRNFTEEEVEEMKKLGRVIKFEYIDFKKKN